MSDRSHQLDRLPDHASPSMESLAPLGRVVSVAGSQVIVQLPASCCRPTRTIRT
jgi:hypothetical protein